MEDYGVIMLEKVIIGVMDAGMKCILKNARHAKALTQLLIIVIAVMKTADASREPKV